MGKAGVILEPFSVEHIQNEPWPKRTLAKTNPVKTNPVKTNPDQNEPWSKQTLSKTDPGQNEPCQKQTLVKTNPGQVNIPWSKQYVIIIVNYCNNNLPNHVVYYIQVFNKICKVEQFS